MLAITELLRALAVRHYRGDLPPSRKALSAHAAAPTSSRGSRNLVAAQRKTALRRTALTLLATLSLTVVAAPDAAAYPLPGRVTGDIGVHDPSAVKRPGGDYLVAH